jgi:hypothetical protein
MRLTTKLVELNQRVVELEARISLRAQQDALRNGHGLPDTEEESLAAMRKRLSSLRRSCEILARHATSGRPKLDSRQGPIS